MLKRDELANPASCINKAAPDEPVFVLRAKDPRAAQAVRLWAAMAGNVHEPEKVNEALHLADVMDKWREERAPKSRESVERAVPQDVPKAAPSWQRVQPGDHIPGS